MGHHLQEAPFARAGWTKVVEGFDVGLTHWLYEITPGRQKIIDDAMNGAVPIMKITTIRFHQLKGGNSHVAKLQFLHEMPDGRYANIMEFYNGRAVAIVKKLRDCKK